MQIYATDIATPHQTVQCELYTALELLRICDRKIDLALDADIDNFKIPAAALAGREDFDDGSTDIDSADMHEAQAVCRVHGAILEQIATGVPTLPDRVFAALLDFENQLDLNPPHTEGVANCLELAGRHLRKALDLSAKHDGPDIDDAYHLLMVVYHSVRSEGDCLDGILRGGWRGYVLDSIVAGEPVPSYAAMRLMHLKERYPSGKLFNGERTLGWVVGLSNHDVTASLASR